jgi:hypothetical protein
MINLNYLMFFTAFWIYWHLEKKKRLYFLVSLHWEHNSFTLCLLRGCFLFEDSCLQVFIWGINAIIDREEHKFLTKLIMRQVSGYCTSSVTLVVNGFWSAGKELAASNWALLEEQNHAEREFSGHYHPGLWLRWRWSHRSF